MKPCDPKSMYENEVGEPDLELEGTHLGRGNHYYDEEVCKQNIIIILIIIYFLFQCPKNSIIN